MKNESKKESTNEGIRELLYIEMITQLIDDLDEINNKLGQSDIITKLKKTSNS